jgi:hypothetical protein
VSSRSSSHTPNGGSRDCADGTTQGRANHCAGSRTASSSRSGTERMRTRLSRQFNLLVHHDEPPSFYSIVDSMDGRSDAVQ